MNDFVSFIGIVLLMVVMVFSALGLTIAVFFGLAWVLEFASYLPWPDFFPLT